MGRAYSSLKASDITVIPIKLKYSQSYYSDIMSGSGIYTYTGSNLDVGSDGSFSQDLLTYRSIKQLYYGFSITGSSLLSASSFVDDLQSTAAIGTFDNDTRNYPTGSGDYIQLISIPRQDFGENIRRNSFNIYATIPPPPPPPPASYTTFIVNKISSGSAVISAGTASLVGPSSTSAYNYNGLATGSSSTTFIYSGTPGLGYDLSSSNFTQSGAPGISGWMFNSDNDVNFNLYPIGYASTQGGFSFDNYVAGFVLPNQYSYAEFTAFPTKTGSTSNGGATYNPSPLYLTFNHFNTNILSAAYIILRDSSNNVLFSKPIGNIISDNTYYYEIANVSDTSFYLDVVNIQTNTGASGSISVSTVIPSGDNTFVNQPLETVDQATLGFTDVSIYSAGNTTKIIRSFAIQLMY